MPQDTEHLQELHESRTMLTLAMVGAAIGTSALYLSVIASERVGDMGDTANRLWNHARHAGRRVVAGASGAKEAIADLRDVPWPVHPLRRLGDTAHKLADRFEEK